MILLTLFIISTIATLTSGNAVTPDEIAKFKAECVKETGVTDDILKKIFKHELIDDHAGKCFRKCMCTKIGSCVPDLKINVDVVIKKRPEIPADKIREFAPICNEITKDDDCDKFYARYRCLLEHIPEIMEYSHNHHQHHHHEHQEN